MWCVVCGVLCVVVCGVWFVGCGVWCAVYGILCCDVCDVIRIP